MERVSKQTKKTMGQQIKECIKVDSVVYQIPVDIWKHFLDRHVDAKTLTLMMRTCRPLYELIKHICENNVRIAWECRKYNQIGLAQKWIWACADNGNTEAMFHIGFAMITNGGWGFWPHKNQGFDWLRKAANLRNISAMACCFEEKATEDIILSSGNGFAIGYWYMNKKQRKKALDYFLKAEDNEYAQYYIGCYYIRCYYNNDDADMELLEIGEEWIKESADNGFAAAQKKYSKLCYNNCDFWFDDRYTNDGSREHYLKFQKSRHYYKDLAYNQAYRIIKKK